MPDTSDPAATNIPAEILESIAVDNVKAVAGQVAALSNLAFQEAVNSLGRRNILAENALAVSLKRMQEIDTEESLSMKHAFTGNAVAEKLAELSSTVKALANQPPTGVAPSTGG